MRQGLDYRDEMMSYIRECGLEEELSCVDVTELRLIHLKKGEYIFHAKEKLQFLYILVEGRAKIIPSSKEGKLAMIDYVEPKAITGDLEAAIGNAHPYLHDAQVLEDTLLIGIPYKLLETKLMFHVPFLRLMCRQVGEKLELASKKHYRKALYRAKNIVSKALVTQSKELKDTAFPFSCKETALSVGISERHLRRILNELEEEGLVEKLGRRIRILDIELLKNMETDI